MPRAFWVCRRFRPLCLFTSYPATPRTMPPKKKSFLSRILNPFASFFKSPTRTEPSHDQLELAGISSTPPRRVPPSYAPRTAQDPTSRTSAYRAANPFQVLSGANDFEMGDINIYGAGYTEETAIDGLFEFLDVVLATINNFDAVSYRLGPAAEEHGS